MQLKCGFTAFRPGLGPGILGLLYCVDQEPNLCYVGCLLIVIVEQTGAGGQRITMQPLRLECISHSCSVLTVLGPN